MSFYEIDCEVILILGRQSRPGQDRLMGSVDLIDAKKITMVQNFLGNLLRCKWKSTNFSTSHFIFQTFEVCLLTKVCFSNDC